MKEKFNPKSIYQKLKAINKIKSLPLFDENFYLNRYPDVKNSKMNPLCHYIYYGYKEKRIPSKKFNGNYYLKKYKDVGESGQNPLVHYVLYGKDEGRFPNKEKEEESLEYTAKELKKIVKKHEKIINELKTELKKYTQLYKIKHVNKEKITSQMEKFKDYGVLKENRKTKLIVSLTSYPNRMYDIHYCLYSLLTQTCKPDKVILWLAREQFPNLEEDIPQKVMELKKHGLTIEWCRDLKSYKKLVFSLKEYPNDIIVTADDDLYYEKDWLEQLYNEYKKNSKCVIGHRAHFISFDGDTFSKYSKWKKLIQEDEPSFLNFPTTGGGVLYPPNILYKDAVNEKLFMNLAPNGDDIWFWSMSVLNNKKTKIVENGYNIINYVNLERELGFNDDGILFSLNGKEGKNDEQLASVINYYPKIKDILKKEIPPKVSIIIPVYNAEKYIEKCLNSVLNQTLENIEIICINDGSKDNSLKILENYAKNDGRIKILNQKNQDRGVARNNGLKIAKGEYIGFIDNDDWVSKDYYEVLYENAKKSNADISATSEVIFPDENKKKNVGFKGNNTLKSIESKSTLVLSSGVMWNKIYKRKLIIKNKICFSIRRSVGEDNIFNILSIILSNKIVTTNKVTYFWKQRKSSRNAAENTEKDLQLLHNYQDILNRISNLKIDDETKQMWEDIVYKRMQIDFWWLFRDSNEELRKKIIKNINTMFPKIKTEEYLTKIKSQ